MMGRWGLEGLGSFEQEGVKAKEAARLAEAAASATSPAGEETSTQTSTTPIGTTVQA
jgi:hypothetical protein